MLNAKEPLSTERNERGKQPELKPLRRKTKSLQSRSSCNSSSRNSAEPSAEHGCEMLTRSSPCMGRNGACRVPIFNLPLLHWPLTGMLQEEQDCSSPAHTRALPAAGVSGTGFCNPTLCQEHLLSPATGNRAAPRLPHHPWARSRWHSPPSRLPLAASGGKDPGAPDGAGPGCLWWSRACSLHELGATQQQFLPQTSLPLPLPELGKEGGC